MLSLLKDYKGEIEINGEKYATVEDALKRFKSDGSRVTIKLLTVNRERNTEQIKGQIMGVLNSLRLPYLKITKIWEKPTNVFTDFSYDPTSNQFLMHPFTGLRIDGEMIARLDCPSVVRSGDSFSNSFDNGYDI